MSFIKGNDIWRLPEFLKRKKGVPESPKFEKDLLKEDDNFCHRCHSYHPKSQECLMPRR
jgi:hypothetical protein